MIDSSPMYGSAESVAGDLVAELGRLNRDSEVHLVLLRNGQLIEITLKVE